MVLTPAQIKPKSFESRRNPWWMHLMLTCVLGHHTPSIAFRHLPPNCARFSYATEEALFISAQLSSDAVSAPRKDRILI